MKKTIAILAGDGIGQEIMPQAVKVLNAIAKKFNHTFILQEGDIGSTAFEKHGSHFPEATRILCQKADAVLFGAVGGPVHESHLPKWQNCEKNSILALRQTLKLATNIRPARIYPELAACCPLKDDLIKQGIDILIIRELIGDIYFGEHKQWQQESKRYARDVAEYNEEQIQSAAHRGFQLAQQRRKKLVSVDKANVLDTSKLWREIVSETAAHYPDVKLEHMLVDNCAMQLIINPAQFDVILTANLFGDILSDAAAALPGSLGLMPSASISDAGFGLYEPSGGSAPDIAYKNIANPIAQILSVAMMLRHSFTLQAEAAAIDLAVEKALQAGFRTKDIYTPGMQQVGTKEMTEIIMSFI
ncbi:MAG: 3-isopropylmalate dehydrogenase [Gammaproteobacteria bacterium]